MNKLATALLLVLLASCSARQHDEHAIRLGELISLDEKACLVASELFDSVAYIPLETNDTFLLGYLEHPQLTERGIYFVSDRSFYLFDTDTGKGLLKIFCQGNGPGEYRALTDVLVDTHSGNVELLDNNGKQILVYDSAGRYLYDLPLPFMPFAFAKDGEGAYWFYNNNRMSDFSQSKVMHYDVQSGEMLGEYFPINPHLAGYFYIMDANNFATAKKGVYYMASPSDTIYRLGDKVTPAYALGLDDYKVPESFWQANYANIMEFVMKAAKFDYIYSMANFSLNANAVMAAFMRGEQLYWLFSYLTEKKVYTGHCLHDDFHFTKGFELTPDNIPFVMNDNYLYAFLPAGQLMEWGKKYAKTPAVKEWIKQRDLNEQDNPVLLKCRLKRQQ